MPRPLEAETGNSFSIDVTRAVGLVSITATVFGSSVAHAIEVERESSYEITNARSPGDQRRHRVAGDHAQGAVRVDRDLCIRALP